MVMLSIVLMLYNVIFKKGAVQLACMEAFKVNSVSSPVV